jgi:uncharacterized protein
MAGFLSGLLGIGGGVFVVPALLIVFKAHALSASRLISMASGTSCAIMMITTSRTFWLQRDRFFRVVDVYKKMILWVLSGVIAGALLNHVAHPLVLKGVFSGVLLIIALGLLIPSLFARVPIANASRYYSIVGLLIGFLSALLGIGGSTFLVPFLMSTGIAIRESMAISIGIAVSMAPLATVVYIITGLHAALTPSLATGYVYWPAVLAVGLGSVLSSKAGLWCSEKVSTERLKKYFAALLIVVALHLILFH